MKTVNYAAIDIGSNAARLLIKKVETDGTTPEFTKQLFLRVPLRLGFDVFRQGRVSDAKAKKMERLMKAYRQLMKIYDVDRYRACATSAMRDAANGPKLIESIFKDTGIQIEIIAGEEEAGIVYNNHVEQLEDRDGNYIYVDVGGGSTEINLLTNGELVCSRSYNIGTIRILNGGVDEAAWQRMRDELAELAAPYG
ncbi:MAG TPA: Ppx/GppA family phosphatase, partial [Candidatus Caccomonas pullistercoris]|nr:Ppx/GppA family phosphatase [Candidatus Caccomonas pullistercoris]